MTETRTAHTEAPDHWASVGQDRPPAAPREPRAPVHLGAAAGRRGPATLGSPIVKC